MLSVTPYLNGPYYFDLETKRVLGVAIEMVCIAVRAGDRDDYVKQAIANKLIALATDGERNPEVLCEQALEDICKPSQPKKPIACPRERGGGTISGVAIGSQSSSASRFTTGASGFFILSQSRPER